MEIVYRKLSDIKPNPKNPRKGTKEAIAKLAESIKDNPRFFEARPILLSDRTGELVMIGGERRSEAARLLGMESVPTILISGLTEAKEDEILIKDNTHAGVWDEQKLATWEKEQLQSWNVDGVKWPKTPAPIDDDFNTDKKIKARCKTGELWQLGRHRLLCGDATKTIDIQKLIGGGVLIWYLRTRHITWLLMVVPVNLRLLKMTIWPNTYIMSSLKLFATASLN